MFQLIKNWNDVKDGDILYLEKVNIHQTCRPIMKNVVIVKESEEVFGETYLYVNDFGGYKNDGEPKGILSINELLDKWERAIRINNIYDTEFVTNINKS